MNQEAIIENSKEICLNYLRKIGAKIEESHGLYSITIPREYSDLFGNVLRRITFDAEIAETHSCELAIPGSNFFSIISNEIKNDAPVLGGYLKKKMSHDGILKKIKTHNCETTLNSITDKNEIAVRFYFNITIKSTKTISMLHWVDVNLQSLEVLDFPSDIEIDHSLDKISFDDKQKIDFSYSKAVQLLEENMEPLASKFIVLSQNNKQRDIDSLNQTHMRRLKEIQQDLDFEKLKLREIDKKILNAKYVQTKTKYVKEREKRKDRVKNEEDSALDAIQRLTKDKEDQLYNIEKHYRPIVDLSLIAAVLYSYNVSQCEISLTNKTAKKNVQAILYDPSEYLSMKCDLCKGEIEQYHLCMNSHAVCDSCSLHCSNCNADICVECSKSLTTCYVCKEILCQFCAQNCGLCSEIMCNNHAIHCLHCSAKSCFFCSDQCETCLNMFCNNSISVCNYCTKRTCKNDLGNCSQCNGIFCPNDRFVCAICDDSHCRTHSSKCKTCSQLYSSNCIQKGVCVTCSNLKQVEKEHPDIQELITINSDLSKINKWEYATNSRYSIFKTKKLLSSKIIVLDKINKKIIDVKKGGLF